MFDGAGVLTIVSLFGAFPFLEGPSDPLLEIGIDRLAPTQSDRRLETTNLHLFLLERHSERLRLDLRLGATATRVTGHITQLEGSFDDGTLRAVRLESSAYGIGPIAEARVRLFEAAGFQLNADLSAGVMIYDRDFPAGGKHYNGMLQAGPSLSYEAGKNARWSLGYRWMHVSNGRGEGSDNPAYEAAGLTLRFERTLDRRR